jgi:hypothetical protein
MGARFCGNPWTSVRHLDHHNGPFTAAGNANLVARRIVCRTRLERLERIAGDVDEDTELLIVVGINHQPPLDRHDPANRHFDAKA